MSRKHLLMGLLTGAAVAVPLVLAARQAGADDAAADQKPKRKRVVVVGGGFAGLTAVRHLADAPVDVTLVDRTNHFVFQPLLYQVALGQLAPTDITAPLRWILRHQSNVTVLLGEVQTVDVEHRIIRLPDGTELPYDYLIMATGARHSYFGHDEWSTLAPGLKTIDDALEIRRRFLTAFERAEEADDPRERDALLTFAIVGGGPTGVELAGLLTDIAYNTLPNDFRRANTHRTRVVLMEGGSRLLPTFPVTLSERARRDLEGFGVEVRTNTVVTRVECDGVYVGDERVDARTVFWAAGNQASPVASALGVPIDSARRVIVKRDLSLPDHPEIFAVGDLSLVKQNGRPVPGVAPAANQAGYRAADNIRRALDGRPPLPFHYFDKGNLATIGRQSAIADFGFLRVAGPLAWWLWLFVHIMYLVGFRNRLNVLFEWAYSYFADERGARLITRPATDQCSVRDNDPEKGVSAVGAVTPEQRRYHASRLY